MVPEVQKPSQEPCIAFYPKRRIRNLLREKHFHGVSSGSRHEYLLKLRYGKVSTVRMDTEDDLLEALNRTVAESLDEADGRSLIVRIALTGRGPLHTSLLRPDTIPHLAESLN